MSNGVFAFRQRAALAIANVARESTADSTDRYMRMADAVIIGVRKPTDAMIDAAMER